MGRGEDDIRTIEKLVESVSRYCAVCWSTVVFCVVRMAKVNSHSWLVLGLVLTSFANSRGTCWSWSCLLTPWVDERFLLAHAWLFVGKIYCERTHLRLPAMAGSGDLPIALVACALSCGDPWHSVAHRRHWFLYLCAIPFGESIQRPSCRYSF